MKYFVSGILSLFLVSGSFGNETPTSGNQVTKDGYKELFRQCNGNKCCEASARAIEKAKGFALKTKDEKCPEGFQKQTQLCIQSYVWCESKPTN
jgi:hypothetical protein